MAGVTTERIRKEPDKTPEESHISLEEVKNQVQALVHGAESYLRHVNANVEVSKFSVDKHGEEIVVDVALKAVIHSRSKTTRSV